MTLDEVAELALAMDGVRETQQRERGDPQALATALRVAHRLQSEG